ncbi:MAG TPA: sialidase family protein, partial [Opitutus sp.]|nr:sialidase family protein [Opitutus sp.]
MKIALQRSGLVLLAMVPLVLAAQVPQEPARTVPDGQTLPPQPGLRIELAKEFTLAGTKVRTAAPPRGFKIEAELGLMVNESMRASVLHHQEGVRADAVRVVRTPGGDLLAVIGCGIGHYAPRGGAHHEKRNDLLAYRSKDDGKTWTGPSILFDVPYSMHGFIPLIPRGTKRLYCFGTEPIPAEREDRENAPIAFRWSDDDGHTWSAPTVIRPQNDPKFKGMSCMQMTETDRGTWIVGSHEAFWDPGSETYENWTHLKKGML